METLLIAASAGLAFIVAYHTYGRWLGNKIFNLSADFICPSQRLCDDRDYIPTPKPIVFGHHFTSIAGTGPIVGPAIAVMWGWLPALLWVVFGSIFIGAVHDFGALVVSLRNNGQTVGDISGRMLNRRVRLLFLFVLFMALTIVLAIFGLVIAAVFKQYQAAIVPCLIQIPIAIAIGLWLHRKGVHLLVPSLIALAIMYVAVVFGDEGVLGQVNAWLASQSMMWWVIVLLGYSYFASVLPVWTLLQPRDYINSLQLLTAMTLIVMGLVTAALIGGAPPLDGAEREPLEIVAPVVQWEPSGAPLIFPFLFITIACGAISGFHCLVSSGTSSKQIRSEPDARFVGFGAMLTEGFLATLVICACVAGLGLGDRITPIEIEDRSSRGEILGPNYVGSDGQRRHLISNQQSWRISRGEEPEVTAPENSSRFFPIKPQKFVDDDLWIGWKTKNSVNSSLGVALPDMAIVGGAAFNTRYASWSNAGSLGAKVGAFVDGAANFLKALGLPASVAVALMGVLVASFAGTTLDTACRLQRYVVQELAATFLPKGGSGRFCPQCHNNLTGNVSGSCGECGWKIDSWKLVNELGKRVRHNAEERSELFLSVTKPIFWLRNKHGATIFAVVVASFMAAMPVQGSAWSWANAGKGGLILWPMFGATNQLLGGLAFLVIAFYLWRRRKPIFFLVLPLLFMLLMPAWAMIWQLFIGSDTHPAWLSVDSKNWTLIVIALVTLVLEGWMIIEALLLWPQVKGVLEP